MATTNRDFIVKNGLIVQGSTATVNGNTVLTTASSIDALSDVVISTPTNGQVLSYNGTNWVNAASSGSGLPSQTGNAGEFLITDGTNASWSNTILANATSTVGLIVKGLASQSANLQEWQDSSGTVLARVAANGTVRQDIASAVNDTRINTILQYVGADATLGATVFELGVNPSATAASRYGYIQTGDAANWRNFVFYPGATTSSTGRVGISETAPGAKLHVSTAAAASIGVIVKGVASQTANLQEWQNSAGTVVMAVTSGGNLDMTRTSPRVTLTDGGSTSIQLGANSGTTFIGNTTNHPLYFITNNLERMRIDASGNIGIGTATPWSRTSILGSNNVSSGGSTTSQYPLAIHRSSGANGDQTGIAFSIYADASSPAAYTPGAAITHERTGLSSVGDLIFKTRPTSGQTDAVVERMRITSTGLVGIGESPSGAMLDIANNTAANVGLIVKAATSQSANLQQWQDSTGSTLSFVRNDGLIQTSVGFLSASSSIWANGYIAGTTFSTTALNATTIPALIRGAASQSANLTEWQNSGGTVLTSVSPTGYITLPGAPTVDNHAATKAYVDSVAQGLDIKASVHAATTTAGTLATSFANGQIIDGVTLVTGDRILIKNQATASENGIYTVNASGAPTRAADMNAGDEFPGAFTFVEEGTANADTGWVCTNNSPVTVGTTSITFSQFSGAGTYSAGNGLTLTGTTFSINTAITADLSTAQTLTNKTINGSSNTITNVSLTTGVTGTLPVANGGTGITSFGTGIATFLGTPSSANLAAAVTDETGSGALVFSNSPTLVTPNIGVATGTSFNSITGLSSTTPSANGTAAVGTSTTVARADHVHPTTGLGLTASGLNQFASTTSAQLAGVISDETGTGSLVFATSPALAGTPTAPTAASSVNTTQIATTAYVKSLFRTLSTGGTLDWNDVSNTRPGVGPTLLLGSATNGPGGGAYYHPLNIEYAGADGTGNVTQLAIAYGSPGNEIQMRGRYDGAWSSWVKFATLSGGIFTGQIQSTLANSTTTGGGQIYLNGATGNRIDFNQNGIAAPAFTTRSVGTKIVLYPNVGAAAVDYALGIDNSTLWQSVGTTSNSFKWYGGTTLAATLTGAGAFSAVTKSFDIEHPTKEGMRLRYGSLEGPENGVYVRGKSKERTIELPDYWTGLVDKDTITVNLTSIGSGTLYVKEIIDNTVIVGGTAKEFFFTVYGERKDVDKLTVEY